MTAVATVAQTVHFGLRLFIDLWSRTADLARGPRYLRPLLERQ